MAKSKSKVEFLFGSKTKQNGTIKTLEKIKKLLSKPESWVKGTFNNLNDNGDYAYCLLGAAAEIDGQFEEQAKAVMALTINPAAITHDEAFECLSCDENLVARFNDDTKRKHTEILTFLDKCIKQAKSFKINKVKTITPKTITL